MRCTLPIKFLIATIFIASMPLQASQAYTKNISKHSQNSFTVLNVNIRLLESSFTQDILSTNADVLCFQEAFNPQVAYDLYELLQKQYAHFYIPVDSSEVNPAGLFIASKYAIENAHFTPFESQNNSSISGVFDFVLTDSNISMGHLYIMASEPEPDSVALKINQIVEKNAVRFPSGRK